MICINVGAPRQRYKLGAQKKSDFVQKARHFHDLAGRGTFGKKKRDCPAKSGTVGRSAWCILLSTTGTCETVHVADLPNNNFIMTEKNQHIRVRFGVGGRGSLKSVLFVRFHKCR